MSEPGNRTVQVDTDEINLAQLLAPLVHHWKVVVGISFGGALLSGLLFFFFAPEVFMSAADLVVMPPKFKTEFQESNINVQYYRTLIESPSMLASVEAMLAQERVLDNNERIKLGNNIKVHIFTKQRAEDVTLSPIIRLAAYGDTPEKAYQILNAWVDHINETIERLNTQAKQEAITFIEKEFPKQRSQYETASSDYEAKKNGYKVELDALKREQKQVLDLFDTKTMELLNKVDATRQKERIQLDFERKKKRRILETTWKHERNQLVTKLEPEVVKAEYQAILGEFSEYRSVLKTIDVEIGAEQEIFNSLQSQLKKTDKTVKLQKRVLGLPSSNEIQNPDYLKLQEQIQTHTLDLSVLKSRKANIQSNMGELTRQYALLRERVNDNEKQLQEFDMKTRNIVANFDDETMMSLAIFDDDRKVGKKKLADRRSREEEQLMDGFEEKVEKLESEKNVALTVAENQRTHMENVYKLLGQKYEQVRLAKAEDEVSLKLATKPFKPIRNMPRGTVKKTIIAGLLFFFLSIVFVYSRELFCRIRYEVEQ